MYVSFIRKAIISLGLICHSSSKQRLEVSVLERTSYVDCFLYNAQLLKLYINSFLLYLKLGK